MRVITTLKEAYIKYDTFEGAYILHTKDHDQIAVLLLNAKCEIPINEYIEVTGQPAFNFIKVNKSRVRLLDGKLIVTGNILVLK